MLKFCQYLLKCKSFVIVFNLFLDLIGKSNNEATQRKCEKFWMGGLWSASSKQFIWSDGTPNDFSDIDLFSGARENL